MTRYCKRPLEIEAIRWTGDNFVDVAAFLFPDLIVVPGSDLPGKTGNGVVIIPTLEGNMSAPIGWWIIRGVKGELYPCDPGVFDATYDEVVE
jgi:hypothetical protein